MAKNNSRRRKASSAPGKHSPPQIPRHMLAKAWRFLGKAEDTDLSKWPQPHQDCVRHYAMLLSDARPPPLDVLWISFGYCVARDLADEEEVASLYTALIRRCTFDEFCAAYECGLLFSLFYKYNITPAPGGRLRHLPGVITLPIIMSVWYLKACVVSADSPLVANPRPQSSLPPGSLVYAIETPLALSVIFNYGFSNCTSQAEREALVDVYRTVFRHPEFDEVELHQACAQGKTFSYVKRFVFLTEWEEREMSRLMKKHRPWPYSAAAPVLRYVIVSLVFVLVCLWFWMYPFRLS